MISIRPAELTDLAQIFNLDRETFGDHSYGVVVLRQLLDLFPSLMFVAEDNGLPMGYAVGAVGEQGTGWILALAVRPAARRSGIGEAISRAVLAAMAAKEIAEVRLTVEPSNSGAIALYRKLGFSDLKVDTDYFGKNGRRIVMATRERTP